MAYTSYEEVLGSENIFNNHLQRLGIPVSSTDRVHQAFNYLRKLNAVHKDDASLKDLISKYDVDIIGSSLHDAYVIHDILPDIGNIPDKILKDKLQKILDGTLSHLETQQSTKSRNYLFELLMYSYLKRSGLNVEMYDPNPDLLLKTFPREYVIQCKRLSSESKSAIEKNIKNAATQLKEDLKYRSKNCFGIIAISIDYIMTSGGRILQAENTQEASESLVGFLKNYIEENRELWQKKLVKDERILGVIIHTVVPVHTKKESMQSVGMQMLINNITVPSSKSFHTLSDDLSPLFKKFDPKNNG